MIVIISFPYLVVMEKEKQTKSDICMPAKESRRELFKKRRSCMELFYRKPANIWEETLPVGNGSLGAMIFGQPKQEKLGLNEESLWSEIGRAHV